jgi:hypothetical protein
MRPMSVTAPEQSMKLVKSTGKHTSNSAPAGSERHSLKIRLRPNELFVSVGSEDGNLIIAIVAILTGAGLILAFIIT